jgi:hypothetical protein
MIEYPVFEQFGYVFEGIPFVKNMGPNLADDGLLGWIEFDEEDEYILDKVVCEIMKKRGIEDRAVIMYEVISHVI